MLTEFVYSPDILQREEAQVSHHHRGPGLLTSLLSTDQKSPARSTPRVPPSCGGSGNPSCCLKVPPPSSLPFPLQKCRDWNCGAPYSISLEPIVLPWEAAAWINTCVETLAQGVAANELAVCLSPACQRFVCHPSFQLLLWRCVYTVIRLVFLTDCFL